MLGDKKERSESMSDIIIESVAPKDIYIRMLIPLRRLDQLLEVLDRAKVEFDSKDEPFLAEAVEYVEKGFFPAMDKLVVDIKREYGS